MYTLVRFHLEWESSGEESDGVGEGDTCRMQIILVYIHPKIDIKGGGRG